MNNKEYTTIENIENYLLETIDGSFTGQIGDWIIAMSNQIDVICNRSIAPIMTDSSTPVEETYYYDGDGSDELIIGECISISEVKIDDTVISSDLYFYPANKSYTNKLKLANGKYFTKGFKNIEVTAIQAMHNEIPQDIAFACTILVVGVINTQKKLDKAGTTERIGSYSITYRDDAQKADYDLAMDILSKYKKIAV